MISIDTQKCILCGICIKVCHEHCMHINDKKLHIDSQYCSTCTQCIAVCPHQALSWNGSPPEVFDKALYPQSNQVAELFKQRRTNRDFAQGKIDRSILEEITGYAAYAPTHNFSFRAVIIDDEAIIDWVDKILYQYSMKIYRLLFKHGIFHFLIRKLLPFHEYEYLKALPKLKIIKKRKKGFKTKPAAIILLVGDKRIPLSVESAQYAIYNIDLYAQSKGLAVRNLGGNVVVFNKNHEFRGKLGLEKTEKVFGILTIGYPAITFSNKVTGKSIDIQWNSL